MKNNRIGFDPDRQAWISFVAPQQRAPRTSRFVLARIGAPKSDLFFRQKVIVHFPASDCPT
jgi:hypothetical protein